MRGIMNTLRGSSTRTELAGLLGATISDEPVHAGIDNSAVVQGSQRVVEHLRAKAGTVLKLANGALKLGGRCSPLHRESPWRKPYAYLKDGDLWQGFVEMVISKGVDAIGVSKVKGHATEESVIPG